METTVSFYLIFGLSFLVILEGIVLIWSLMKKNSSSTNISGHINESIYPILFQKSSNPVMLLKNRMFIDLNEAALKYLKYDDKDELIKKHPSEISPKYQQDGQLSKDKADKMMQLAQKNGSHQFEWEHISKDGSTLFVEINLTIIDFNGIEHTHVVMRDQQEKRKVEKELHKAIEKAEESDRLKSAFLESISHEIRTPMNAIIGFAQLLNYENNSVDDIKEFVNYINKSGNSLLFIIDNIIDVSNLRSGVLKIYESRQNLNSIFDDMIDAFMVESTSKNLNILLENQLADKQLIINTDGARLRKSLYQLVNNSIKFTEKGNVICGCKQNDDMLEFYVKDTGIGISDHDKSFVFNVFRKGSFKGEKLYGGTGLGLSIAKASIESMGGKIWLNSEEGVGTEVSFTIPLNVYKGV